MTEADRPAPGDPATAAPDAGAATSPATQAAPLVAWEAPAATSPITAGSADGYGSEQPPFTVGALLSDTFARYGADVLRLLLVSLVTSGLSWLTSLAAPMSTNPFAPPPGFVDVSGLLALLSFVAGIVGSATTLALAEGGPGVSLGRALRRGVERSGWLFLTSLLMGAAFFALFLVALIPIGLFAIISPILVVVPILALFAVFVWAGARLMLALPATVADNLNALEAAKLSWRVTKPTGVWARQLGASLLLGLLVAPAAFGSLLFAFPAILSTMFTGGMQPLYLVVPAIVFTLLTPFTLLVSFSAYRRLVPPMQPSWTKPPGSRMAAPLAPSSPGPAPATEPPFDPGAAAAAAVPAADLPSTIGVAPAPSVEPAFRVPRMGAAAKALLAIVLVFDVVGLAAIPYGIGELARIARDGIPGFPGPNSPGFPGIPGAGGYVVPGQVAFGRNANLDSCAIEGRLTVAEPGTPVEFLAALERTATPRDEVFLRVTRDGQVLETSLQEAGTYDCLGSLSPEPTMTEGVYTYEVIVNGTVSATGSLIVG
jgi:hypothetical protein